MRIGQVTKCYIVECGTCTAEEVAWDDNRGVTKNRALHEFKAHGWREMKGVWRCSKCLDKDRVKTLLQDGGAVILREKKLKVVRGDST